MHSPTGLRTAPPRWLTIAAVLLAGLVAALVLVLRVKGVGLWSHDAGGVESNVIHGIQKMLMGRPLYEDPERPTYDVIQYAPLYYWIAFLVGKLLAIDPLEPISVFKLSRALSLVFNLASVLLFHRIIRERSTARALAFFLSVLLLVSLTRHFFSRPDSLYLLLFLAGLRSLLCYIESDDAGNRRRALIGVLIWSLAGLWAKHAGVLLIGLAGLYTLVQQRWRDTAFLALGGAVGIIASIACLASIYGLRPLEQNMVTGLRNGFSTELFRIVFLTPNYLFLLGIHLVGAVYCVKGLREADPRARFLGLAIGLSFLFAMVTGMKSGSRLNYFIENFVFIYLAIALVPLSFRHAAWNSRWPAVALVAGALFMQFRARELRAQLNWLNPRVNAPERYQAAAHAAEFMHERGLSDGQYVYSTGRGFVEHFLSGQSVLDQKDIVHYSDRRLYDYSDLLSAMTDGRVRYVVSDRPVEAVDLLDRTFANFREIAVVDGLHILETTALAAPATP